MTAMSRYPLLSSPSPSMAMSGTVMMLITPIAIIALTERNVLIFALSSIFCVMAPHRVPYGIFTQVYPSTRIQYVTAIYTIFDVSDQSGCAQNVSMSTTAVRGAAISSQGRYLPHLDLVLSLRVPMTGSLSASQNREKSISAATAP